jgi:uncharacterized membrane protein YcfT
MKPLTQNRIFLSDYKFQPLQRWKLNDYLKTSGSGLRCWLSEVRLHTRHYLLLAQKSRLMTLLIRVGTVLAALVARAIPVSTRALIQSAIINNRFYAGLILVVIVAPLSACIHALPGMKDKVNGDWFYENYHDLYLVLGPYFFCICIMIAAFLWVPPKTERIKISRKHVSFQITRALSIPLGLVFGKIVWLICCTNNEDFDLLFHPIFLLGTAISYPIVRLLEYLVWRQEHAMNALIDSLEGLYRLDIDKKEREKIAAPLWRDLRQFNSKY